MRMTEEKAGETKRRENKKESRGESGTTKRGKG